MSDKLTKANELARAAMCVIDTQNLGNETEQQKSLEFLFKALAAYEAAPAESQAAGDWVAAASKVIARWAYGYYNGSDWGPTDALKYWDGVGHQLPGPKWTVEVVSQLLTEFAPRDQSQQLAAAQARIAFLEGQNEKLAAMYRRDVENVAVSVDVNDSLRARVAVLEKALIGFIGAESKEELQAMHDLIQTMPEEHNKTASLNAIAALLAAQPSREKDV